MRLAVIGSLEYEPTICPFAIGLPRYLEASCCTIANDFSTCASGERPSSFDENVAMILWSLPMTKVVAFDQVMVNRDAAHIRHARS